MSKTRRAQFFDGIISVDNTHTHIRSIVRVTHSLQISPPAHINTHTMHIDELFRNPTTSWKWDFKDESECTASFTVGKVPYIWFATLNKEDPAEWEVSFTVDTRYAKDHDLISYGMTGTGNSAQVMSTVVDITKAFLHDYSKQIDAISFSADEDSRLKLYARMIKRLLPNWIYDEAGGHFYLIRPWTAAQKRLQ